MTITERARRRRAHHHPPRQLVLTPAPQVPVELQLVPAGTTVKIIDTGVEVRKITNRVLRQPGGGLLTADPRDLVVVVAGPT